MENTLYISDEVMLKPRPEQSALSSDSPVFSVIVTHYQGTQSDVALARCMNSLAGQTIDGESVEVLLYHDGPLLRECPEPGIICMDHRYNDYGHSLRDRGIREAKGQYIVHLNADGFIYPEALATIKAEIQRPPRMILGGHVLDTNDIIIFPVRMWGQSKCRFVSMRSGDESFYLIFTGHPPFLGNIDCMQLVMKRSLWLAEGGWHDKRAAGDGHMYQEFCRKYGYRLVGPVLGEHF
jgi:hypothetical protein